jgi:catechol 2,3-dioxygenase-like lactoylglutathione lyase family enzyme
MVLPAAPAGVVRLSRLVLMVRGQAGLASAVEFYHLGLGLPVLRFTDEWAELLAVPTSHHHRHDSSAAEAAVTLALQATNIEAQLSIGYSPWITFEVTNMEERIAACTQAGAHLDGPLQHQAHGTVALLRTPDNHMIGLYQPATQT